MEIKQQPAANAYRRHDSGFSSLDKNDSLANFRDSVQEKETSDREKEDLVTPGDVAPGEAHALQNGLPVDLHGTCPAAMSNCYSSDSSLEEFDGGETLETGAIREYYSDLCNAVGQELDLLSTELYSRKFIERTKLDQILEVSGTSVYSKAVRVLSAASNKIAAVPSMFHAFLQALEKCGVREITQRIKAYFDEQSRAYMEQKQRLPPIGGSDDELTAQRPSSAGPGENTISESPSRHKTQRTKSFGRQDVHGDSVVQRQVRQLNIEVLQLSKENRTLRAKIQEKDNTIKEQDATIAKLKSLENDYEELLASHKNLEMQNSYLLGHSRSLRSLNGEEDIDHPHTLLSPSTCKSTTRNTLRVVIPLSHDGHGWAGCQACRRKGNTRCKESTV